MIIVSILVAKFFKYCVSFFLKGLLLLLFLSLLLSHDSFCIFPVYVVVFLLHFAHKVCLTFVIIYLYSLVLTWFLITSLFIYPGLSDS